METITLDSDISQSTSNSFEAGMPNRTGTSGVIPNGIPTSVGPAGRISTNFTSVPLNYFPNPTKNINCILVGELVEAARCIVKNSATFAKCSETSGEKWEIKLPSGTSVITVHLKNRDETIIHEIQERSANEKNANTNSEVQADDETSNDTSPAFPDLKSKKMKVSEDGTPPEFPLKECFVKLDRLKIDTLGIRSNSSLGGPIITSIKKEIVDDIEDMDVHASASPKIVSVSGSVSEHDDSNTGETSLSATNQPVQVIIKKEIVDAENTSCDGKMEIRSVTSQKTENIIERKACSTCGFFAKSPMEQALHSCNNKSTDDVVAVGGNFNHPSRTHCCIKCQRYSENGGLCSRCKNEKNAMHGTSYGNIPNMNSPGEMFEGSKKPIHTVGVIHDPKEKPFIPFHIQQHVPQSFTAGNTIKEDLVLDNVTTLNGMEENKIPSQTIPNADFMNNFQGKIGAAFSLSQDYSNVSTVRPWNSSTNADPNFPEPNKVSGYTPYIPNDSNPRIGYEEPVVMPKTMPELTSCSMVPSGFQNINQEHGKGQMHHQFESHVAPINPMNNAMPVLASYHSESKNNLPSSCALSDQHFEVDVKPFVCEICKQAFMRQDLLKEHQKMHMQEKIFSCNQMMQPSHSSMDDA